MKNSCPTANIIPECGRQCHETIRDSITQNIQFFVVQFVFSTGSVRILSC